MPSDPNAPILTVEDYEKLPAAPADVHFFYGEDEQQFGDLYLPEGDGPHPVVVLLHGGCWRARYGLAQLGGLCRALAGEGTAVWNLEYRRIGIGGGWPFTFRDVAAGVDSLRRLADRYGLDLARVAAAGHSAGGHLALWLAGRERLPENSPAYTAAPLPIQGVVSLAGIPDLAEAVRQDICRGAPQELMGGRPEQHPQRYAQASPVALLPLGVPQILINGGRDEIVPTPYVEQYAETARRHGESVRLENLPAAGHFELVVPDTFAWPSVRDAVLELLEFID